MSRDTIVDVSPPTPPPTEALIPEARYRQRRRYRRAAVLISLVALLAGALVAVLIAAISGGPGTTRVTSNPTVAAGRHAPVLVRPVLCLAPPYVADQTKSGPLPVCAAPYQQTAANLDFTPNSAIEGYSSNNVGPDPALTGYPDSTRDSQTRSVLLAGLKGVEPVGQRYVLGPAEMRLSAADVDSASAVKNPAGRWMVNVHLSAAGTAVFDHVADESFHQLLAIDVGGNVVSASLIEPTQASFSSFDGVLSVSGNLSASNARAIAAAVKQ
jgi:hypothetical protein